MDLVLVLLVVVSLAAVSYARSYLRTGVRGFLLISIGSLMILSGGVGMLLAERNELSRLEALCTAVTYSGGGLACVGFALSLTLESGKTIEAFRGHSVFEIIAGSVSGVDKEAPPAIGSGFGVVLGIMVCAIGLALWLLARELLFPSLITGLIGLGILVGSLLIRRRQG